MSLHLFLRVFVTVIVILDPIGNVPVFLALTSSDPSRRQRRAAQATAVATAVILAFAFFGQAILSLVDISLASLQVAGGLILGLVALQLLTPSPRRRSIPEGSDPTPSLSSPRSWGSSWPPSPSS